MPVTLRRFWIAAGIPTPHTPIRIAFLKLSIAGLTQTYVFFRLINNKIKKYRHATQLERNVASPAPAAPRFNPHGIIKIGSNMIFNKQPLIVPTLAWRDDPSERTKQVQHLR